MIKEVLEEKEMAEICDRCRTDYGSHSFNYEKCPVEHPQISGVWLIGKFEKKKFFKQTIRSMRL